MDKDLSARLDELQKKQESLKSELLKRSADIEEEIAQLAWEAKSTAAQNPQQEQDQVQRVAPPPLPKDFDSPKPVSAIAKATPDDRKYIKSPPEPKVEEALPAALSNVENTKTKKEFDSGEWELNFGRVWLVRIGVLLLLTGLVFLSTYAYKNWLFHAGAGIKVAFFMTISLMLTGAGLWLENWREGFRQYGRVLASGGLAAGYYTIYASHFVPSLKLVDSAVLAGALLTVWAGIILGYAVWKRSRVVAVMAIGLAFYGTIVNPSGWLSLFSALLLSCAGIWLMLRFRWVSIGLGVVAAAYGSHAFWLGFYPGEVIESVRLTYLACYWVLFTSALLVPQAGKLPGRIQRWMAAINNTCAWSLTVFSIPLMTPNRDIGWISLGVGMLWIGLAALARGGKLWHRTLAVIFGYQGLMIASLGILIEATGYTRFLVLAVEACVLMLGARNFGGILARAASVLVFIAALVTALPQSNGGVSAHWLSYAALAVVCAIYTGIVRRAVKAESMVAFLPAAITWMVLGAGVFNQWNTLAEINGIWIAAMSVMLLYLFLKDHRRLYGLQELAIVSVPVALVAGWLYLDGYMHLELWQSIIPIIGAGVFWYMCPRLLDSWDEMTNTEEGKPNTALEWVFSVLLWLMLGVMLGHHMGSTSGWLVLGGVLALSGHGLAELFKRSSIGGPAMVYHAVGWITLVEHGNSHPLVGWVPALMLTVHLALVDRYWKLWPQSRLKGLLALGLTLAVGVHAFQEFERPDLTLTVLGLLMAAWSFRRREPAMMMAGCVLPLLIACPSAVIMHGTEDWLRYLPIVSALMLHALLWRETKEDDLWKPCRIVLLISGLVTLFFASSVHVERAFDGSGLAICWALLASLLFCAGLAIRCRPYRLIGLWWLGAAVLHVVCIDVMRLGTLGRILSFITLGLVLLGLGFLYNKFQDTIRKFL